LEIVKPCLDLKKKHEKVTSLIFKWYFKCWFTLATI